MTIICLGGTVAGEEGERRAAAAVQIAEEGNRSGYDADVRGGGVLHVQHPAAGQQRAGGVLQHSAGRADRHEQPAGGHQLVRQLHHLRHLRRQVQAALFQDLLAATRRRPLLPRKRPRLARGDARGEFCVERPHVQRASAERPAAEERPRRQAAAAAAALWPLALRLLPRRRAQEPRRAVLNMFSSPHPLFVPMPECSEQDKSECFFFFSRCEKSFYDSCFDWLLRKKDDGFFCEISRQQNKTSGARRDFNVCTM